MERMLELTDKDLKAGIIITFKTVKQNLFSMHAHFSREIGSLIRELERIKRNQTES